MSSDIAPRRLAVLADEIGQEVRQAESAWQDAVTHAINAGEKLIEAKGLVGHGEWLPWLKTSFTGSERTARNYMRLASNRQRVADLPTVREALSLLAPEKDERMDDEQRNEPDSGPHEAAAKAASERGDHLTTAKEYLAAAKATREAVREWSRHLLSDALRDENAWASASLARTGAAGLVLTDHWEPWDERYAESRADYLEALRRLVEAASKRED